MAITRLGLSATPRAALTTAVAVVIDLSFSALGADDTSAFNVAPQVSLAIAVADTSDTASFAAAGQITLAIAVADTSDTASFATAGQITLAIAVADTSDTASFAAAATINVLIAGEQTSDVAAFNVAPQVSIVFSAVSLNDTALINASNSTVIAVSVINGNDAALFSVSGQLSAAFIVFDEDDIVALSSAPVLGAITVTINLNDDDDVASFVVRGERGLPRIRLTVFADRIYGSINEYWNYSMIAWPNVPFDPTDPQALANGFMRPHIAHAPGDLVDLGSENYRRFGTLFFQTFAPRGAGLARSTELVTAAQEYLRRPPRFKPSNVLFRDPSISEIGVDGGYYQVNVSAGFQYDSGAKGRIQLN